MFCGHRPRAVVVPKTLTRAAPRYPVGSQSCGYVKKRIAAKGPMAEAQVH